MKVILQTEAAECGLACLAMVAAAHGNDVGLRELRLNNAVSLKGSTLSQIMGAAAKIHFTCRPLRLDMEHLGQLRLPCILHWDLSHFVVLTRVGKRAATVIDPASGRKQLPLEAFSNHFTGVALELTPAADFKLRPEAKAISLSKLTGRITGARRSLGLVFALSIALQVFVLLAPFLMQWVVDHVLIAADRDLLTVLCIGFLLVLFLQVGTGLLRGWAVIHVSSGLGLQWTANVFGHLLKLPLDFYAKRHLGDTTSRMGSVQDIQRTLTSSFVEALIDGIMAVAILGLMLLYSWKLAMVTLGATLLYTAGRMLAFHPFRTGTEQHLVAAARQHSHLLESIRGAQSIKIAGREPLRRSGYFNLLNATVNSEISLARLGVLFAGANQLIFGVERVVVVWIGAVLAMQNAFSVGMLIAYLAYKDQFAQRVGALIDKCMEVRMLRLHCERLSDIVLTEPEQLKAPQTVIAPTNLRLEVEGLSYRYAPGEPWVIRNLSMTVEQGESVAIVGASGCGKTTLIKLLLGLLIPTEGQIRLGGVPLEKVGTEKYRSLVGAVMQDDQLFAGSISDNIAFQDEDIDDARVIEAAGLAGINSDIESMPMGYNSLIGDMGTALSGGQKQRVILARALYRQPSLLFLDEATSHLDVECEQLVSKAVSRLDITRVIIAHRPETIDSADRVLVLDAGVIVQEARRPLRTQGPFREPDSA